jgi:hypothetical protein
VLKHYSTSTLRDRTQYVGDFIDDTKSLRAES